MASLKSVCILIVDDSQPMRSLLRCALAGFGFSNIRETANANAAHEVIAMGGVDLVLVDYWLGSETGVDFCRAIRNDRDRSIHYLPLIMVTGYAQEARVMDAINAGVDEYLVKPLSPKDLAERINAVIEKRRPFFRTADFHGPDRRHSTDLEFNGPLRRFNDQSDLEI